MGADSFFLKSGNFFKFFELISQNLTVFEKVSFFRKWTEIEILPLGAGHDILIIELRFQQTWFRNFFLEGTCSTNVS